MSGFNVTKITLLVLMSTMLLVGPATAVNPVGDLNSSGEVDIGDLEILAGQWLDGPGCIGHPSDCADLVGGGDGIDIADFGVMSENWLKRDGPAAPILSLPANGVNVNGTSIYFSWNASAGADNYYLQVAADSGFDNLTYDGAVGDTTSINVGAFPDNGRKFYWRMQAGYFAGEDPEVPLSEYLVSAESNLWLFRRGQSEPPSDWRELIFTNTGGWQVGQTSIGYSDGDDNTELTDMKDTYKTVYLRHLFEFEIPEGYDLDTLTLKAYVDDGCIVSLNGQELTRFHVSAGDKNYDDLSGINHEASVWDEYEVTDPLEFPVVGTNVLAVHALNHTLGSTDFSIDVQLIANFVPDQWSEYSATGYFDNGPAPTSELTIENVYLAQTHVLEPDHPLFKLVGNRDALLKVQVIAPVGTAVPTVTALVSVGNENTTLTLDGPDTLQDTFKVALGLVQHQYNDSFTTLIPAEWIRPGLNIAVTAGSASVDHDIKVGAPTELKMKMFDVHYFGLNENKEYSPGAFEELEAKWPTSSLEIERVRDIDFLALVVPARSGLRMVRVISKQNYYDQTGQSFDGEQAAALQWVEALSASGGNFDVAMQYINIMGVSAGGQAGGFDGVGAISMGIFHHELGHALNLPHWGDNSSYPYKGDMYGIEAPDNYNATHVGPAWAFDLPTLTFIPPTVQENSIGGEVGKYKKSPMQGGGVGDQEENFLYRHFSDYGMERMQRYVEGKVAVLRGGNYYRWNDATGDYTTSIDSNGVRYPIEEDVQVISVMASTTLSDRNVNTVYPPIGPYEGNLILTFDPTDTDDMATADDEFCPSGGCDFSLRVMQGGQQKIYMLAASGTEGSDPYSNSSLKTKAVNLRASDGTVTQVELLLTPNAEKDGLPSDPEILDTWTE